MNLDFWFAKTHVKNMSSAGDDTEVVSDEIIWLKGWQQNLEETHEPESVKRRKEKDIWRLLRVCKAVQRPISVKLIKWFLDREGAEKRGRKKGQTQKLKISAPGEFGRKTGQGRKTG